MARRRGKAASRLHVRIVAMFSLIAVLPALLVAVIASITLDIGLDRWFEIRTKTIINSSLSIAEAYVRENARNLQGTTLSMANDLDNARAALRPRPHRISRIPQPAGRRQGAGSCGAHPRRRVLHHECGDAVGFRHARAAGRSAAEGRRGPAGADRAAHQQHRRRDHQAAPDRGRLSLHDPAGRPRSHQGAPDRHREHQRISWAGGEPAHHADRLRPALSRPDADHRAVGDLDRHRRCGPAGPADPPADRRGRRGGDRQSRRVRAGAPVRRRRRLARRHVQQDAAAAEVAAQRDPPREGSRRRTAALLGGGACRRHGGRHRRRPLRHDHHRQPLGRGDARPSRPIMSVGQNLSTLLPHVGRVFEIGRKSGRPVYREQVTFYRTAPSGPSTCR